jgi:mono/diheme cytochrome c family protein
MLALRLAVIGSLALIPALFVVSRGYSQKSEKAGTADIERGRYLVEDVAMCGECHTPRNDRGELEQNAWLQGAHLDYARATEPQLGRASIRRGDGARGRSIAAPNAHLPYETRGCESDHRVSEILARE